MAELTLYDGSKNILVSISTMKTLLKALEDIGKTEEVDQILHKNDMGFEASVGLVNFLKTYLFGKHGEGFAESPAVAAIVASAHCPTRPDPPVRPPREPKPSPTPEPKPK